MTSPKDDANTPTATLVLGSGGARGLAHIGVIRALEDRGIRIRAVVGCSMGAVVGGIYCADKLDVYEEWACELTEWDVVRFLDISLALGTGLVKGEAIMLQLRKLIGDQRVEALRIPLTVVATNLDTKREVWLNSGDLFDAIRASIGIPGLFAPKEIDGHMMVDGGLLNPLPTAAATFHATDLIIAVSLAGGAVDAPFGPNPPQRPKGKLDEYRSMIDEFLDGLNNTLGMEIPKPDPNPPQANIMTIMLAMFDTMQGAIARHRLASYPPDILIEIPNNVCETHEFYKARELIAAGRHWTEETLSRQKSKLRRA